MLFYYSLRWVIRPAQFYLNNKVYYKLWYSLDNEQPKENWNSWGLVRESNDTVYQYSTEEDAVLYNFALKQGDSIRFDYMHIVDSIKTVTFNNTPRKKYYLSTTDGGEYVEWIEGIGSLNGPVYPYGSYSFYNGRTDLLCVTENDTEIYNNPNFDFCSFTTSINQFENSSNLLVYPNPTSEIVSYKNLDYDKIELYNFKGELVFTNNIKGQKNYMLNVTIFPPGIYLYAFQKGNSVPVSGKLIIR